MLSGRYFKEFAAGMAAYGASVALMAYVLPLVENPILRPLVALLPMVPALTVCWVVLRQLRRMDELQQRIQIEAIGLAFAGTAVITFGYGFLEIVGFSRLSMFVVWPLMATLWIVGTIVGNRRYR
ncbi:hypothetical protein [Neorhizobium sp. DT-125]|uniref:hypothetical protein n=1 Tax=Neorhizobium sp. DT-125 TaxID=3396163 RepID=UPI003F19E430